MSTKQDNHTSKSNYISLEGKKSLLAEWDELWYKKRPQVTQSVREAALLGDRSENAEYIYGKKQLRQIDSRLRFLKKRIENVTVVDSLPRDMSKIFFGATVKLEDEQGEHHQYQLLGCDEIDLAQGKISIDSPLAKALLGKSIDDDVSFQGPKGILNYYILDIQYPVKP